MSFNRSGYIGRAPGDSSITIARKTYEPTGVQTDFTFSAGYDPGYCDVYLNGIKLINGNDYTASNGSTVGLTSAAQNGDIVEVVAYKAFNLGQPLSDITGDLTISDTLTATNVSGTTSVTAGTFYGSGSQLTGVASTDYIITGTAATFNSQVKVLNLNVTGITSTTSFNVGSATTIDGGGINVTGVITATSFGPITSSTGTFSGAVNVDATTDSTSVTTGALIVDGGLGVAKNVYIGAGLSVAGTLTYEDVTSVDSVGLITAKSGVNITGGDYTQTGGGELKVGSGLTVASTSGVATFADGGSASSNALHFGSGGDLTIHHDGSNTFIDNNTGYLNIKNTAGTLYLDGSNINLRSGDGGETYAVCNDDGAVEIYHNNSKKFETTGSGTTTTGIGTFSNGIHVPNGNATADNIALGNGSELQIWHNGTYSAISADTFKVVDKANGHGMITADADGAVGLRYDNSQKFETTNDGVKITGIATCSNGLDTVGMQRESFNTVANKLSAAPNIDLEQGMIHYFTTTETTTATPNIRYSSTKSLNNMMSDGDAITVTIITTAAAAGYSANWEIDGSGITEEWVGGSAPSAGGSDGFDIYTANILKTGSGAYKVFINLVNAT